MEFDRAPIRKEVVLWKRYYQLHAYHSKDVKKYIQMKIDGRKKLKLQENQ